MLIHYVRNKKAAAGGSFTPDDLFQSGEVGLWFTPTASNCFTDAGVTTAVVTDNVHQANVNGNYSASSTLLNATGTQQPILRQDGSTYYLEFDGGDRLISSNFLLPDSTDGCTVFARFRTSTFNNGNLFASDGSTARLFQFRVNSSNQIELIGFTSSPNYSNVLGTVSSATWHTACGIWNPTSARVWLDTMTDAAGSSPTSNVQGDVSTATQSIRMGARDEAGSGPYTGDISFVLYIDRALTETERGDLNTYVNGL